MGNLGSTQDKIVKSLQSDDMENIEQAMETFAAMVRTPGKLGKVRWAPLLEAMHKILVSTQQARAKTAVANGLFALSDAFPNLAEEPASKADLITSIPDNVLSPLLLTLFETSPGVVSSAQCSLSALNAIPVMAPWHDYIDAVLRHHLISSIEEPDPKALLSAVQLVVAEGRNLVQNNRPDSELTTTAYYLLNLMRTAKHAAIMDVLVEELNWILVHRTACHGLPQFTNTVFRLILRFLEKKKPLEAPGDAGEKSFSLVYEVLSSILQRSPSLSNDESGLNLEVVLQVVRIHVRGACSAKGALEPLHLLQCALDRADPKQLASLTAKLLKVLSEHLQASLGMCLHSAPDQVGPDVKQMATSCMECTAKVVRIDVAANGEASKGVELMMPFIARFCVFARPEMLGVLASPLRVGFESHGELEAQADFGKHLLRQVLAEIGVSLSLAPEAHDVSSVAKLPLAPPFNCATSFGNALVGSEHDSLETRQLMKHVTHALYYVLEDLAGRCSESPEVFSAALAALGNDVESVEMPALLRIYNRALSRLVSKLMNNEFSSNITALANLETEKESLQTEMRASLQQMAESQLEAETIRKELRRVEAEKNELMDSLVCAVCLEVFIGLDPVAFECGHIFCKKCYMEVKDSEKCPTCRATIGETIISLRGLG